MVRAAIDTAVVLFAAALLHAPLFLGLNTTTTDHFIHYRWASQFAESLASGIWRPSWEATSRGGLGDPVFLFYPPVFYYAVAALDAVFRDIWLSIRMVLLLSSVATGVGVLLVARARGVSDLIARSLVVLSAASPMLLGISGYINAYPWYVATTVLVFAVIALQRAISRAFIRDYAVLAGLIGLIGLIHSLTAMMFAFTVFLSVMFEWLRSGFRHTRDWVGLGAALALGLSISAVSL